LKRNIRYIIILPNQVHKSSDKKFIFDCPCGHEIIKTPRCVTKGIWCSYCCTPTQTLCEDVKCNHCFERSFASSVLAEQCISDINLRMITKNTQKLRLSFKCKNCSHIFTKKGNNNSGCPYCSNLIICNDNKCILCYNKSFASHPMSKCWSSKNVKQPREYGIMANQYAIFECNKCFHEFGSNIGNITNLGRGCPYCSNTRLCTNVECTYCFNRSFASKEYSIHWDYSKNNGIKPRDVFKSSGKKYHFTCPDCKSNFISGLNFDSWCGKCQHVNYLNGLK
jgi:hypothetical protein